MSAFNETQGVVFVLPRHGRGPRLVANSLILKSSIPVLAAALWHAAVSPRSVEFRNIKHDQHTPVTPQVLTLRRRYEMDFAQFWHFEGRRASLGDFRASTGE